MEKKLEDELNKMFDEYCKQLSCGTTLIEGFIFSNADPYSDADSYGDACVGSDW